MHWAWKLTLELLNRENVTKTSTMFRNTHKKLTKIFWIISEIWLKKTRKIIEILITSVQIIQVIKKCNRGNCSAISSYRYPSTRTWRQGFLVWDCKTLQNPIETIPNIKNVFHIYIQSIWLLYRVLKLWISKTCRSFLGYWCSKKFYWFQPNKMPIGSMGA